MPRFLCRQEDIRSHFAEAFPSCIIKDLRFAYNVEKLMTIHKELANATKAKDYCEKHAEAGRDPFYIYPVGCSRCCSCFCCCCGRKEEAYSYYSQQEERLGEDFEKAKETALKTPLGKC